MLYLWNCILTTILIPKNEKYLEIIASSFFIDYYSFSKVVKNICTKVKMLNVSQGPRQLMDGPGFKSTILLIMWANCIPSTASICYGLGLRNKPLHFRLDPVVSLGDALNSLLFFNKKKRSKLTAPFGSCF